MAHKLKLVHSLVFGFELDLLWTLWFEFFWNSMMYCTYQNSNHSKNTFFQILTQKCQTWFFRTESFLKKSEVKRIILLHDKIVSSSPQLAKSVKNEPPPHLNFRTCRPGTNYFVSLPLFSLFYWHFISINWQSVEQKLSLLGEFLRGIDQIYD